ncbi:hypothetical protein RJ640_015926 [Escallonia rubra]|uniref:Myosin heavy chain-like protein n=1 Tax=Escallonia rubra TaxID=112253 RepID=A0AA88RE69_9ASTE|nr:hypothetical protein RJ640_015926 [Escallonia rubra]
MCRAHAMHCTYFLLVVFWASMSRPRANSSPDLLPRSPTAEEYDDSALEGVAANIKLLLKIVQDHKEACTKQKNDGRRMLRVAGMMTILDNVRTRIQKCQSFGSKRSEAELRRCKTDLKTSPVSRDKRPAESIVDEKERLQKDLNSCLAARKSLEVMCSSLGKEKEIMAGELARKVHELNELEDYVSDLKAQNATLSEKVQEYAAVHKEKKNGGETHGNAALQERNKTLSEQLLRSLDGYRSMKRKLKEAQEENSVMRATMEEMGAKFGASLDRIRGYKQTATRGGELVELEDEISELEHMFECFDMKFPRSGQKKGECVKPKERSMPVKHPFLLDKKGSLESDSLSEFC